MPKALLQPEGSALCGQTCVAMAAGVSLQRASAAVGHNNGTVTKDLVRALRALGIPCAARLRRVGRVKPVLPKRAILAIHRPERVGGYGHWLLTWDGTIYDPGGRWPEGYPGWRITSYLALD